METKLVPRRNVHSTAMDNAYDSISEESHSGSEDQETVPEAKGNPFKK